MQEKNDLPRNFFSSQPKQDRPVDLSQLIVDSAMFPFDFVISVHTFVLLQPEAWRNNVGVTSVLQLNPEQRAAVQHGEGPLLVIAGPGSGKTRAITQRIVHLLGGMEGNGRAGTQPENILALTFTEKAAEEMRRRVRQALPQPESHPFIATFHAFCLHLLRQRHFERQLLDKIDLWIFLRQRLGELALEHYRKLAEPGAFLHDLNEFFSRCQDELVEPDDFAAYVGRLRAEFERGGRDPLDRVEIERKEELARLFRRSRELVEQAGFSTLGSLMSEVLRLWHREPETLERSQSRFRYVLVDEFQDTNYAQVELLRRLVVPPYNLTAVGDDDQAIYRFRGASHGAFEMFDRAFPGHAVVYLNRNYRSTGKILRASQAVIAKNDRYRSKPALRTDNPEGSPAYLLEAGEEEREAAWIASEVERLAQRGWPWGDMAVLYRSHHHRGRVVKEFRRRGIPFTIRGLSILSTTIVRDLVAYLRVIHSPHHNVSLTRILLAPRWRFPEELARDARRHAYQNRSSIYTAIRAMEQTLFAPDLKRTGWSELKSLLAGLRGFAPSAPVTALFDRLTKRLGLRFLGEGRDQDAVDAFRKFLQSAGEKSRGRILLAPAENRDTRPPLDDFMEYFQQFLEAGGQVEPPASSEMPDAVQMMTVHAAKGLEFGVVFILSVAPQRFPHREERPVIEFPEALRQGPAAPPGIHLQEERRLFYVAMTRAEERLYVSSLVRTGRRPSVFIEDLLSDPLVAARDLDRIRLESVTEKTTASSSAAGPSPAAARAVAGGEQRRVLLRERAADEHGQWKLFDERDGDSQLHPNLEEWLRQRVKEEAGPGDKLVLSATAIEAYRSCPLRFKFLYRLKIPREAQATLTFGGVMHQSIRHYFKLRPQGPPPFEEVERFYRHAWKDVGFEDAHHAEQYKQAGIEQLREFVADHNQAPLVAESVFEQGFALDVDDVRVEGRIDQIQPLEAAPIAPAPSRAGLFGDAPAARAAGPAPPPLRPGAKVELIDYKTGRPRSQKDADKSLQLSLYALAAERSLALRPVRLTFYNLTSNQPVSTVRTGKDLEAVVREVGDVASAIRAEQFEPTPGFVCRRCSFVSICPAHEED